MHAAILGRDDRTPVTEEAMAGAIALSDWLREHQGHAWKLIGSAGQITESAPLDVRVATAIVALEGEIQGGMLPTARIAERVNEGAGDAFHVDTRAIGKCASRLGLVTRHFPDKSRRGVVLTPGLLAKLRYLCP